jgi:hypothetical protein
MNGMHSLSMAQLLGIFFAVAFIAFFFRPRGPFSN